MLSIKMFPATGELKPVIIEIVVLNKKKIFYISFER